MTYRETDNTRQSVLNYLKVDEDGLLSVDGLPKTVYFEVYGKPQLF